MTETVTPSSGSVFKDLDVVLTPEEWDEMNRKHGTDMPYPFARIIPFPTANERKPEEEDRNG